MSATASPAVPAGVAGGVTHGWTAGRARRVKMFMVLLLVVAAAAVWSSHQPWYGFATAGPARCDRPTVAPVVTVQTPQSRTPVGGVYAAACITGQQLAEQYETADLAAGDALALELLSQDSVTQAPEVMFGLPRTVAFVVLSCAIGALALGLRNGWLGLLGIVGFYFAHRDLGALQALMSAGPGGALNQTQPGLGWFGYCLLAGAGLLVSATLLVVRHNADARHVARAMAEREGHTPPPGALDFVFELLGKGINRSIEAAATQRSRSTHTSDSAG